jgi:UDP-glucose 4-epimerase
MNVLLTGGAGYIGSHATLELLNKGHIVTIVDNFSNSQPEVIQKIQKISGKFVNFIKGDINDYDLMLKVLKKQRIELVIHLAGLKSVSQSILNPIEYYCVNVSGLISLLNAMTRSGIKKIIYSSSATIYGEPKYLPIDEIHPVAPLTPYGNTKLIGELLLGDLVRADPSWGVICLRYFNPAGAHESGLIGEEPITFPSNLMPAIGRVIQGKVGKIKIFGGDYETHDGTAIRDFIHVTDLAEGHVIASENLSHMTGFKSYNLGLGTGYSILDIIKTHENILGGKLNYELCDRRDGDIVSSYSNPLKARLELGWFAKRSLVDMCSSSIFFYKNNKNLNKDFEV